MPILTTMALLLFAALLAAAPARADDGEDRPALSHKQLPSRAYQWTAPPDGSNTRSFTGNFLMQGQCPSEVNIASLPDATRITGDVELTVDADSIYINCGRR